MWWNVPSRLLSGILDASWHATFLVVMVVGFQFVMRRRLPARWRFALWLLVLVRLSGVALPESRLSVFNWVPRSPVVVKGRWRVPMRGARWGVGGRWMCRRIAGTARLASQTAGFPMWGWVGAVYVMGVAVVGMRMEGSMWRERGVGRRSRAVEDAGVRACLVEA